MAESACVQVFDVYAAWTGTPIYTPYTYAYGTPIHTK